MTEPLRDHDPHHPYVLRMVGCGHGRLFTDYCRECEIVELKEQYKNAVRTVQLVRNRLRQMGQPLPGETSK